MVRAVPRAPVKGAIKKRLPQLLLDANVDLLIYLNCVLFLQRLAAEAQVKAIEDRCSVIKSSHLKAAARIVLQKSRG